MKQAGFFDVDERLARLSGLCSIQVGVKADDYHLIRC